MTFRKVLDLYYDGQIHDTTLVWDSACRHWHQFAEFKLPLLMRLPPGAVTRQIQVAWTAGGTGFEAPAEDSNAVRRGGSRLFRGLARQTTLWWFGVPSVA